MKKILFGLFVLGFLLLGSSVNAVENTNSCIISSFTVDGSSSTTVSISEGALLEWRTSGCSSVLIYPLSSDTPFPLTGEQQLYHPQTRDYVLTAYGYNGGSVSKSVHVTANTMASSQLAILSPNSGFESIESGKKVEIRWTTTNIVGAMFNVYVSDGIHKGEIVSTSNTGSLIYTLGENLVPGSNYKAYIVMDSTDDYPLMDSSDNPFTIKPVSKSSVEIISPNDGGNYTAGNKITIKWLSYNVSTPVFVALHKNGGWENVVYLSESTPNDGTEVFTLPSNLSGEYRIRIGTSDASVLQGWSNRLITITSHSITEDGCPAGQVYSATTGQRCGCSHGEVYSSTNGQKCIVTSNSPVISGVSGPQTLDVGEIGTWKVKASYSDIGDLSYSVIWGDETLANICNTYNGQVYCTGALPTQQSATFTHTYTKAGTYKPSFSVVSVCTTYPSCPTGGIANTSITVKVGNSTNNDEGCRSGFKFSTTTGQPCSNTVIDDGCKAGYKYSPVTGQACTEQIHTCSAGQTGCGNPSTRFTRTLKVGEKGDEVKALQALLNILQDGSFGPATMQKVKEWQAQNGLTPDGVFGYQSRVKAGFEN